MMSFKAFKEGTVGAEAMASLSPSLLSVPGRMGIDIGHCLLCMGEIKSPTAAFTWLANNHWC